MQLMKVEHDMVEDDHSELDVEQLKRRIAELEEELELVRNKGKLISQEVDLFRQRRVIHWLDRFRNRFDAWNLMNPGFQQLKDDTTLFGGAPHGFKLQPSISLTRVSCVTYNVRVPRPSLKALLIAPVVDVPLNRGEICLRILSGEKLLATSTASVAAIRDDSPTLLEFPPVHCSDEHELTIRIFVQGVDAPVRVFELRKHELFGFARTKTRCFAGFVFEQPSGKK